MFLHFRWPPRHPGADLKIRAFATAHSRHVLAAAIGWAVWGLCQAQPATAAPSVGAQPGSKSAAFAFRDVSDGISCKFFDVALGMRWPDDAVTWADATGRHGGSKPFDVQLLDARTPPKVMRWNVLALFKGWARGSFENDGLVLSPLSAKAGGGADFHSREAEDVSLRPSLRIQHPGGGIEYLSAQADAGLDCSTYTGLGGRDVLHIGPANVGVLRFDLSRLRKGAAQDVTAAELVLVRNPASSVWSDGALGVYRLVAPWHQPFEAPERGIAAAFSADKGLENHPSVVWFDNFEKGALKPGWNTAQMVRSKVMSPLAAPGAGRSLMTMPSLQATIPRGEQLGLDLRFDFPKLPGKRERSEAYFRYYLRLGPEWADVPDTGKLPGLAGTYNRAAWGGRGWHGMQGWSARGSFAKSVGRDHPAFGYLPLSSYVYHSKSESSYGDIFVWGGQQGEAFLTPNRWVCIEQHIKLNTPGREDGVLRAWVDGKPVFARTNFRFRDTLDLGIENVWFDLYMGGQRAALRDMNINIAHVVVANRYIGPMSP